MSSNKKAAKAKARKEALRQKKAVTGSVFIPTAKEDLDVGEMMMSRLHEGLTIQITEEHYKHLKDEMQLLADCLKDDRANFVWAQYFNDCIVLARHLHNIIKTDIVPDDEHKFMFDLQLDICRNDLFVKGEEIMIAISERCKAYVLRASKQQVLPGDNPFRFVKHGNVEMVKHLESIMSSYFNLLEMADVGCYRKAMRLAKKDFTNANHRLPRHFTVGQSYPITYKDHEALRILVNRYREHHLNKEGYLAEAL